MARSFTINPVLIRAGAERHTAARTPGENFHQATVQLIDGGAWNTTPGHIVVWGFQRSDDGGANWDWSGVKQEDPNGGLPFGSRDRSGGMPALTITRDDFGQVGTQLRLAIVVDADIVLGAQIDTV